ncbi:cytokinin riboside 5'-monophosphate phosphoribohydrolase [Bacteroidia bacterium]|nr:cytokinin riboside 5'-monophosphate phosphoribohydrolase [Bacteroidia bacterium]
MIQSVCVYCASSARVPQHYLTAARDFGRMLAENNIHCIYGGGHQGLMGYLAEGVLSAGGHITGIIPRFMVDLNWHHCALPEMVEVATMHERKELMLLRADAAVALPGGIGTFEELVEAITWRKLGLFPKRVFILNANGFYNPLLQMFEMAVKEEFMEQEDRDLWTIADNVETLIEQLKNA